MPLPLLLLLLRGWPQINERIDGGVNGMKGVTEWNHFVAAQQIFLAFRLFVPSARRSKRTAVAQGATDRRTDNDGYIINRSGLPVL